MATTHSKPDKIRLSIKEKLDLLRPYVTKKIMDQVKAVALIIIYLVLFQTIILQIPVADSLVIAAGIGVIVFGLAFFMEGLFLGLMPLGETIGLRLPQKAKLPSVLLFALILGIGVTFAEPAIGVLQVAGSFVKAWDAPLLFLLLNKNALLLKYAVGLGVGLAVVAGMSRFFYGWSLKPFLYVGVPLSLALSIWANFEPNMVFLSGVAWDCGGVTTGPVTVPLVLALGIGVSRIVSKNSTEAGGFGVVTLASLFPVIAVFALGAVFLPTVPKPMASASFFAEENRAKAEALFEDEDAMIGYALRNAKVSDQLGLFSGDPGVMLAYIARLGTEPGLRKAVFGTDDPGVLRRWAIESGSAEQRRAVFGGDDEIRAAVNIYGPSAAAPLDIGELVARNGLAAVQAILPLTAFLLFVLLLALRDKLPHPDEIAIGVIFALIGMLLFSIGIELGLSKLGNQVGSKLPASFKKVELVEQATLIRGFDPGIVQSSIRPDGSVERFFYANLNDAYVAVPYDAGRLDAVTGSFEYVPTRGPILGGLGGILLVVLFAFVMGYGATLAEPALNALGSTVEILTVGAFKKSLLMQTVAVGVGIGIAVGVMKIIWGIPLVWLLAPPYILLLGLSKISTEEFVNIGWDSAGVTTGPITVPLVLAIGLGIGNQIGAVEGFGILATASVYPILTVLSVGLVINARKRNLLRTTGA